MSWSYYKSGRAAAVKEDAAKRLEQCAAGCDHIPSEAAGVRAFAAAVDAVCDAAGDNAVKVQGNGSAYTEDGKLKGFSFSANIEVFDLS